MTESDVKRIEQALDLSLPADYRHLLLNYPVHYSRGTTEETLWDHADALIARNRELRTERRSLGVQYHALPKHLFLIGEDGAGWQFLIDLRTQPSMVQIMEFERVEGIRPATGDRGQPQAVSEWLHEILQELKHDGININAETKPGAPIGWGCLLGVIAFCLVAALAIALMVVGIQALIGR